MVEIHDIPPEILAVTFVMGIYTWGIGFLRPIPRVCQNWRDIVNHTPRLYGIISIPSTSSTQALERQIAKAKESPLSLTITSSSLSSNWVSASVGTTFLVTCRWAKLGNLESLTLTRSGPPTEGPGSFFDSEFPQNKLSSFTAKSLPKSWTIGFLSPSIRHFGLCRGHDQQRRRHSIQDTWDYLTRIPGVVSLDLENLVHTSPAAGIPSAVLLPHLRTLRLSSVLYPSAVLCAIAAPSLQMLSVDRKRPDIEQNMWWGVDPNRDFHPLSRFFAQWSQPGVVPAQLHTLELKDCIEISDVPYLIRWLERLPNLVRLSLKDDAISCRAQNEDTNLYRAFASPRTTANGEVTWLCPFLTVLYLDTDQEMSDVVLIARARGGRTPPGTELPTPRRLRRIETRLCPIAEPKDIVLLQVLVDEVYCVCTNCGLMVEGDCRVIAISFALDVQADFESTYTGIAAHLELRAIATSATDEDSKSHPVFEKISEVILYQFDVRYADENPAMSCQWLHLLFPDLREFRFTCILTTLPGQVVLRCRGWLSVEWPSRNMSTNGFNGKKIYLDEMGGQVFLQDVSMDYR